VARLHHEPIARGDRAPVRWLVLTHGMFGAGSNWRGIARKINERRPEWGIVLVDLRAHGRSEHGEPPHTIAACAADLRALCDQLAAAGTPIDAVAGHSFGGKVALAARALAAPRLRQTWVLDASPSIRREPEDSANSALAVLALMEQLPRTWPRRDDFVAAVTAAGHSQALARWLAMNLVPDDAGAFVLRLDLAVMRAMIDDYRAQDLWRVLLDPALPGTIEIVIAERSTTISEDDRARLAAAPPHVHVDRIAAGHWLHIEAPAEVIELFVEGLPMS